MWVFVFHKVLFLTPSKTLTPKVTVLSKIGHSLKLITFSKSYFILLSKSSKCCLASILVLSNKLFHNIKRKRKFSIRSKTS